MAAKWAKLGAKLGRRAGFGLALAGVASAQPWAPTRSMRMIVPFPPGGSTDTLARMTAERLGAALGQSVVIDNRPGAAGSIAADIAGKTEPDGQTLFFASIGTAATNQFLYPSMPHNAEALAEVAGLFSLPNMATVAPAAPWRTLGDFIAAARARPGQLTFGSSGAGSSLHLTGALLAARAGIDILHVPYRGAGQMMNELVAGRISIAFGNISTGIGLVRDGVLRPLATTGASRNPALPDVPSFGETIPGFVATVWYGLQVPRGTPAAVIERLNRESNAMLADAAVLARLTHIGVAPMGGSAEDFSRFIGSEIAQWRQVIRTAGITAE
jgi:tripartite-type tricarboxylate transporter receptor subunit TctC